MAGKVSATVAAIFALVFGSLTESANSAEAVSPRQAVSLVDRERALLIDIREPREWRTTGVPRFAERLSEKDPDFEGKLLALLKGDRSRTILLICANGGRSHAVQARLVARGFTAVTNVVGGVEGTPSETGWLAEGLPMVWVD